MVGVVVSRLALLLSPSTLLKGINCPNQYQQKINLFMFLLFCGFLFWSLSNRMINSQFVYTRESTYKTQKVNKQV